MMKTEPSSAKTANATTLRSPSPHRNAYEASIGALRPANDILNSAANGDAQDGKQKQCNRGRTYGSNVHRIKNMFMQMGASSPTEGEDPAKVSEAKPVRLTLPRAGSLNENVDHSALLKLGATVSERVSKFDPKAEGGGQRGASSPSSSASSSFSKLQETRKIFEQHQQQERQAASNRVLLKKERVAGIQDGRLDVVARFNGSTESLDSLDAVSSATTEAVSPTVSQLSAVFERAAELRNNLHRLSNTPPLPSRGVTAKPSALNSKIISKRVRGIPAASNREDGSNQNQNGKVPHTQNQGSITTDGSASAGSDGPNRGEADWVENGTDSAAVHLDARAQQQQQQGSGDPPRGARGVHSPLENGKEASGRDSAQDGFSGPGEEQGEMGRASPGRWRRGEGDAEEPADAAEGVQKEGYSSTDHHLDISAYSAAGEESAGSQEEEEEEEEEDEAFEPESSCTEIAGLPAEDETPPSRKIRFSTNPIKVRWGRRT